MKILEFHTTKKDGKGSNYIVAIPINKIFKLESVLGGENVYLKVNDIEVTESYWGTKKLMEGL